jgi:hypothetical protein
MVVRQVTPQALLVIRHCMDIADGRDALFGRRIEND